MLVWITAGLGIVAFLFSLFFGWKACEIFSVPEPKKASQRFYLFWFNFLGRCSVGWPFGSSYSRSSAALVVRAKPELNS